VAVLFVWLGVVLWMLFIMIVSFVDLFVVLFVLFYVCVVLRYWYGLCLFVCCSFD